jgi:hypothetical protein
VKAAPTAQSVDLQTITINTSTYAEELGFLDLAHGTSAVRHNSNNLAKIIFIKWGTTKGLIV